MFYIHRKNGLPTQVLSHSDFHDKYRTDAAIEWGTTDGWSSRWDWKSLEEVETLARYLTAMTGKIFLGVDKSESVSPRFDIIEAPKVGDPVSYAFNGDCTPCGHVERITKNWMVITTTGRRFNRKAGGWLQVGGTWSLVTGHFEERNPHI